MEHEPEGREDQGFMTLPARNHRGDLHRRHGEGENPGYGAPLRLQHRHRAQGDGESRRQEQVKGLTWSLRQRLLKACAGRLIDTRNRALVAVLRSGFGTYGVFPAASQSSMSSIW